MSGDAPSPPDDVFINCPFDVDYTAIREALIFTLVTQRLGDAA